MNATLVAGAVGSAAACAHAQFIEVLIEGQADVTYVVGQTLEYSVWLRAGDQISDFDGWASYEGRMSGPGSVHNAPAEASTDNTTSGDWDGRRPPSTTGFPGGAAGGFRFTSQTFTPIVGGLEGSAGQPFRGHAASVVEGGFQLDTSADLEVFRGSFTPEVAGDFLLSFDVDEIWYYGTGSTAPLILIDPSFQSIPARYAWVPTPATALPLGFGLVAVRRRR